MNIALRKALTVDDYLTWAATQADAKRTELIRGQIVPVSPELVAHNRTKIKVLFALQRAVTEARIEAEVFTDGLTVPIEIHTAYEPDASVRLGPPLSDRDRTIPDPIIVIEVLSPTSIHMDTSAKLVGYFKIARVRHYLVIDPETRSVTHHARGANDRITSQARASGTLDFDPPGIAIDVDDLFG
jgi:Uma2 family endonuclease